MVALVARQALDFAHLARQRPIPRLAADEVGRPVKGRLTRVSAQNEPVRARVDQPPVLRSFGAWCRSQKRSIFALTSRSRPFVGGAVSPRKVKNSSVE